MPDVGSKVSSAVDERFAHAINSNTTIEATRTDESILLVMEVAKVCKVVMPVEF